MRAHNGRYPRADARPAGRIGRDMDPMTAFHSKPMTKPLLIFDMDGVLVDVGESYRETIARTVEHFTGGLPTREQIQQYKNAGGWNDDWKLSHHMVCEAGVAAAFDDVREH